MTTSHTAPDRTTTYPSPVASLAPTATTPATVDLAVLDMAGTTVADDGLVERAFAAALDTVGSEDPTTYWTHVRDTMGQSKIEVFRALFDEDDAQRANTAFDRAYREQIEAGAAVALPGAEAAMRALRDAGVRVALTTGFARDTQARLVAALGWDDVADLILCPADAGRGRPFPDLVLTAVLRLGIDDVARVAVVGDTANDVLTGRRAGAAVVAGVLTGAHDAERLRAAGATHVLRSIAELPDLLLSATPHQE